MGEPQCKVLLIEVGGPIGRSVARLLESAGCEVVMAMNHEEALEKAESERPNVVLLDLFPPESAIEVLKHIKKTNRVPVLAIADIRESDFLDRALELGADDHLKKPLDPDVLARKVLFLYERAHAWAGWTAESWFAHVM